MNSGKFVPDEGGRIIKFSDYHYSPFARPIWNLPGYFRPVAVKPADKPPAKP